MDSILKLTIPENGGRALTDAKIAGLCSKVSQRRHRQHGHHLQWILTNLVKYPAMQIARLRDEVAGVVGTV